MAFVINPQQFSVGNNPVPEIAAGAQRYRQMNGLLHPEQDYSRSIMPASQSPHISAAYNNMQENTPEARAAYKQMGEEVGRQFDFMTKPRSKGGMGIQAGVTDEDPYGKDDPLKVMPELRSDVQNNNRINVLSTKSTGGHPFFSNDQNDMFRAVHDYFGHLGSGRGVDFNGEEAAYQKHAAMFSPQARGALASETRGQNSYLRTHGDFPEQKVGLMPQQYQGTTNLSGAQFSDVQMARQKNAAQGLA